MDLPRSAPRDILVPEVHPDDKGTMNEAPQIESINLSESLLVRARSLARFLRMDTFRDLHVETDPDTQVIRVESGSSLHTQIGFEIFPDEKIRIYGSNNGHVPERYGAVCEHCGADSNVLGNGGRAPDGSDPLSQLDLFASRFPRRR